MGNLSRKFGGAMCSPSVYVHNAFYDLSMNMSSLLGRAIYAGAAIVCAYLIG